MSSVATITLTLEGRPDPSADTLVRGLSDAQAEAARRFGRTQIDNFMRRAEQLHGVRNTNASNMGTHVALDALITGRGQQQTRSRSKDPLDLVNDRRDAVGGAFGAASAQPDQPKGTLPAMIDNGSIAIWTGGSIQIGSRDQTSQRVKLNIESVGVSGGADIRINERLTIGLGGGYGQDVTRLAGDQAHLRANNKTGAAYLSATPVDGSFVDAVVGYGDLDFRTRRLVTGSTLNAYGQRDGSLLFGSLSAGVNRIEGQMRWSLYGRGVFAHAILDAYAEQGGGNMNLRFDRRSLSSLSSVLGTKIGFAQPTAIGLVTPWLRAEWTHEFRSGGEQRLDYADIAGAAFYGIATDGWRREQFDMAVGANVDLLDNWAFVIELGARTAEKERAGTAKMGVSKRF